MTNGTEELSRTANTVEKKAPIFGVISFSAPLLAYGIGWLVCKDMKGGESGGWWIAAIFLLIVLVTLAAGMICGLVSIGRREKYRLGAVGLLVNVGIVLYMWFYLH